MANIRLAEPKDVAELVGMGMAMHKESPRFSGRDYSIEKSIRLASALIENPDGIVIVAESDGQIIGMAAGIVCEHFFGTDRIASDLVVYVKPENRGGRLMIRLVRKFEEQAAKKGAIEFSMGVTTMVDEGSTVKIYQHMGYQIVGTSLLKTV